MKVKVVVAQSYPTFCDPLDCSPPGCSVCGILQARILEWVAMPSSRASSQPRDRTHISCVSCVGRRVPYHCTTWEASFLSSMANYFRFVLNLLFPRAGIIQFSKSLRFLSVVNGIRNENLGLPWWSSD